jgi:CheY-like chemotaxis protein
MEPPVVVLMYGLDSDLMRTRKMLLENSGYFVHLTTSGDEAKRLLDSTKIDLLLLCQTLPTDDCDRILRLVPSLWPWTKTLVLQGGWDGCSEQLATQIHNVMNGPRYLLETIDRLVQPSAPR